MTSRRLVLLAPSSALAVSLGAGAQTTTPADASAPLATAPAPAPEASQGIVPIPDYTGDIWTRPFLLGDLDGGRTSLAQKGVQFSVDFTQIAQSVVDGGVDNDTRYGGNLDYNFNFDLMRMGVLPGAVIKFRAESRYGKSVNSAAGPLLPVNTDAFFPLATPADESIPLTVTNLLYTQYLAPTFALFAGKFDTLDGDLNEFASGRGTAQFLNANLIFNSVAALGLPYSTLGAGLVWAPAPEWLISSVVMSAADSSTTSGFDSLGDGWFWSTSAYFQYRLGRLPGGVSATAMYSWENEFVDIGKRFVFNPGEGVALATEDTTWSVSLNAWQYLFTEGETDKPVNISDGRPDLEGIGLFARLGFADEDTNPIEWDVSVGLGGRGLIPTRDNDTLGVGYFYQSLQTGRLAGLLGVDDQSQGVEAFYTVAFTPAAALTLDIQWADSPRPLVDDAIILGARLRLQF